MNIEKRNYCINAEIRNCEIRKVEEIVNTFKTKDNKEVEYHYLLISADDCECNRIYLKDKDISNINKYKRGTVGDFYVKIICEEQYGIKAKIIVTDFVESIF